LGGIFGYVVKTHGGRIKALSAEEYACLAIMYRAATATGLVASGMSQLGVLEDSRNRICSIYLLAKQAIALL